MKSKRNKQSARKREILANLDKAVAQVKQHKQGTIKLKTLQEVLTDL